MLVVSWSPAQGRTNLTPSCYWIFMCTYRTMSLHGLNRFPNERLESITQCDYMYKPTSPSLSQLLQCLLITYKVSHFAFCPPLLHHMHIYTTDDTDPCLPAWTTRTLLPRGLLNCCSGARNCY